MADEEKAAPKKTAAKAEETPAESGTGTVIGADGEVTAADLENVDPGDKLLSLQPTDPEERAASLGLNTEGMNFDPEAGQSQMQAYANAVEETGYHPPSGGPPDDSLTVTEVVKTEQAEKEARFEAQREALGE